MGYIHINEQHVEVVICKPRERKGRKSKYDYLHDLAGSNINSYFIFMVRCFKTNLQTMIKVSQFLCGQLSL